MDINQLIIVIVSLTLTTLLVVLGIQVYFILGEIRSSFQKFNKMLEDFGKVTGSVGTAATNVGGFIQGMKSGMSIFTSLNKKKDDSDE